MCRGGPPRTTPPHSQTYMYQDLPCMQKGFKTVELAADQKLDPSDRNLEKSEFNRAPTFSEGCQNFKKPARTLYFLPGAPRSTYSFVR